MNSVAVTQPGFARSLASRRSEYDSLGVPALVAVAAAALAVAVQSLWIPLDADVSWLITVCERMLSGDRLYVDIIEVNPPASVWLYLPLVWLAKALGARPEATIAAAFALAGVASVLATLRLASKLDDKPDALWLSGTLSFIALVLPMGLFAQREHAALLLTLPVAAALALIAEGKSLPARTLCAAGIAAGLVVVIKPVFALAVVAPALWALWRSRTVKPLIPGVAVGTAVVGLYVCSIAAFTPAYFRLLPVLTAIYARMAPPLANVFIGPIFFPLLTAALVYLLRPRRFPPLATSFALASAGFVLAAVLQAKNYVNHLFPGTCLALAAAFVLLAMDGVVRRRAVGAALLLLAVFETRHFTIVPDPAVAEAVRRVAPPSPTMISLSPELTVGHPVTRNVGGRWVGTKAALFTAHGARRVGLDNPVARAAYREDIAAFAADVRTRSPDVILVDTRSSWLRRDPMIVATLRPYRAAARAGRIQIWTKIGAAR